MRTLFFILLLALSCSTLQSPESKETIAESLSQGLASAGECARPDLIKKDILDGLERLAPTPVDGEQSMYGEICKVAVTTVLPYLLKEGVKKEYECKLELAERAIKTVGTQVCGLI